MIGNDPDVRKAGERLAEHLCALQAEPDAPPLDEGIESLRQFLQYGLAHDCELHLLMEFYAYHSSNIAHRHGFHFTMGCREWMSHVTGLSADALSRHAERMSPLVCELENRRWLAKQARGGQTAYPGGPDAADAG